MPTILLKKSDTASAVPSTANLTNLAGGAEVAVNTADKRMFTMNSSSAVVELGTNPSSLTCADVSATLIKAASANITNLSAASATVTTGNLAFTGTAQRITGDFSNATLSNRLAFQTSTANTTTAVTFLPNGTGTVATLNVYNNSDPTNASVAQFQAQSSADVRIASNISGTGTYLPMTFYTGGSERVRIDTSGNTGFGGTAAATAKVQVLGTLPSSGTLSFAYHTTAEVPSGTTGAAVAYHSKITTAAASFTLGTAAHFLADPPAKGAGSTITNQMGFYAESTLTGATNNYGFYSNIASGSNRWNFYAAGTAQNYFAGNTGVGTTTIAGKFNVGGGRSFFGANSETYSIAVGYTQARCNNGQTYYIGATDSATPDLVFSNAAGTERMRLGDGGGLSVGTTAVGTAGEIRATNNITAYYSDARLKDFKGKIGDALYKVSQLNGYYYTENEKAEEFGYNNKELQVGVSAQEVQAVLPEVVTPAPFDLDADGKSKSGEDYMTVRYEKLVPLLIEAIKELKAEVEALKAGK
jgi:hypothetical protein